MISGLYCTKKLRQGYDFKFIKDVLRRIEGKLMYLKHKLKSQFYFILKKNYKSHIFNEKDLESIIKQLLEVEKISKKYFISPDKRFIGFYGNLKKD